MCEKNYFAYHGHSAKGSERDGVSSIKDVVKKAKELNHKRVVLTDHGTMAGINELAKYGKEFDIDILPAIEFYFVPTKYRNLTRSSQEYKEDPTVLKTYHLTVLAVNETGYQNLTRLQFIANTKVGEYCNIDGKQYEGRYYFKPRIDEELLFEFQEGLVVSSGCRLSIFNQALINDNLMSAKGWFNKFSEGLDNFLIEIHPHQSEVEEKLFHQLKQIAKETNLPAIVANDYHYVEKGDLYKWNLLGGIRFRSADKKSSNDDFNEGIPNDDFYMKSHDEMYKRVLDLNNGNKTETNAMFTGFDIIEDLANYKYNVQVPSIHINDDYRKLKQVCEDALIRKGLNTPVYQERLAKELEIARQTNNCSYFLFSKEDIIDVARDGGYLLPFGRGSAASLLISFLLDITRIDPIVYDLIVERAMNPNRSTLMDIDFDFSPNGIQHIVSHLKQKYGNERVLNISTQNYFKFNSSLQYVLAYLGIEPTIRDTLSKDIKIATKIAKVETEEEKDDIALKVFKDNAAIRNIDIQRGSKRIRYDNLLEYVTSILGAVNAKGVHAAGYLITPQPVYNYLPTINIGGKMCSGLDMDDLKDVNALKIDLLTLNTVAQVEDFLKEW